MKRKISYLAAFCAAGVAAIIFAAAYEAKPLSNQEIIQITCGKDAKSISNCLEEMFPPGSSLSDLSAYLTSKGYVLTITDHPSNPNATMAHFLMERKTGINKPQVFIEIFEENTIQSYFKD